MMDCMANNKFAEFCDKVMETGKEPDNWVDFVSGIDIPGKIMSLQSYGMPDTEKIDSWMPLKFRNLAVISEINHTSVSYTHLTLPTIYSV